MGIMEKKMETTIMGYIGFWVLRFWIGFLAGCCGHAHCTRLPLFRVLQGFDSMILVMSGRRTNSQSMPCVEPMK